MELIIKKLNNLILGTKDQVELTTVDFKTLGYSFESFLRYAQVSGNTRLKFHKALLNHIKGKK